MTGNPRLSDLLEGPRSSANRAGGGGGASGTGVALGLASHALAGLSPFIVAAVIARTALLTGTALVYVLGTAFLLALLLVPRVRHQLLQSSRILTSPSWRTPFATSLAGFLVAGVAFYVGLTSSPRVAEYVFLTRLDWIVQAPVAILVLRERWTWRGLGGAAIALGGGMLIVSTGAVGSSGLAAALVYVGASLAAYLGASRIAKAQGLAGAATLAVWRHVVNTAGFVALAVVMSPAGSAHADLTTVALGGVSALVLLGLFLCRFAALTRLPLWVLAAQAPVQAVVALLASRLTEGAPATATLVAVAMIVAGEAIVATSQASSAQVGVRR